MWFKKKKVPETNETKIINVVQLWEVRWLSRHGEWRDDTKTEVEVFASKEEANAFREALENAFRLIKHTAGDKVTLEKAK
jgi:hypothetical protein